MSDEMRTKKAGKWEISMEPEPWDAYFYIGYEHDDPRAPMSIQEGLRYFNELEVENQRLRQALSESAAGDAGAPVI